MLTCLLLLRSATSAISQRISAAQASGIFSTGSGLIREVYIRSSPWILSGEVLQRACQWEDSELLSWHQYMTVFKEYCQPGKLTQATELHCLELFIEASLCRPDSLNQHCPCGSISHPSFPNILWLKAPTLQSHGCFSSMTSPHSEPSYQHKQSRGPP